MNLRPTDEQCKDCRHYKAVYDETGIEGQHNIYVAEEYCELTCDVIDHDEFIERISNCPLDKNGKFSGWDKMGGKND